MEEETRTPHASFHPASAETLREGLLRLDTSFERAPVGLAHLLPDGRLQRLNATAAALLGVPAEAAAGRPLLDLVHPDDRLPFLERLLGLVAGSAEALEAEVRLMAPGAATRWLRVAATLVREGGAGRAGAPFYCIAVLDRLDERRVADVERARADARRAADALVAGAREAFDQRLRVALDTMIDCVGVYRAARDADGRITDFVVEYVNDAACANNRMTREEQVGRGLCALLPGHRESGLFDDYVRVVETGAPLVKELCTYRDVYGDGESLERAFDIRVVPLDDGFVAAWRDVTPRVRAAHELRSLQRQMDAALAASNAGAWRWRLGSEGVEWDAALRRMFGLRPDGPLALADVEGVVHPEDREHFHAAARRALAGDGTFEIQLRMVPRGSDPATATRWVLHRGETWRDAAERVVGLHGVVLDVTELVAARQRAERLQAFTAALAVAEDAAAVCDVLLAHGRAAVGATAAAVVRPVPDDPATLEIVGAVGYDVPELAAWTRFPLAAPAPMAEALRLAEPVWTNTAAESAARFPDLAPLLRATGYASWLAVPFVLGENGGRRVLGGLGVAFSAPGAVTDADRAFLVALGRQAAQALERARLTEALREREARHALVSEAVNDGLWDWDVTTGHVVFSPRWAAMLGHAVEELAPHVRSWEERVHPDDLPEVARLVRAHLDGRTAIYETEHRVRHRDGHWVWIRDRGKVVARDAAGRPLRAVGTHTDVTELRARRDEAAAAQAQARRALEELEALYTTAPVGLAFLDAELRFVRINERQAAMNGVPAAEHLGRTLAEVLPALAPAVEPAIRRVLATGESVLDVEVRGATAAPADGDRVWLASWRAVPAADGSIRGVTAAVLEVTDRVRAEAALRDSEARARALVANLPGGAAFVVDDDLRYRIAGGEALRDAGFTPEHFVGRTVAEALEPEVAAYYTPYFRRALAGETFVHEHETHGRVFVSRGVPLRDGTGAVTAALAVSYDITERRRGERERDRLVAQVQAERDRLRLVFEQAPSFAAVLRGPSHVFEFANAPYVRMIGDRPLLGRPVREVFPDLEGQGLFELLDAVLATGEPFVGRGVPVRLQRTPDAPADERVLDFVYQPLTEPDGTCSGIVVQGVDVTEQARARAALEAERAQLTQLIEVLPVMVAVYDPSLATTEAGAVQCNRAFVETLGWSAEDARTGDIMARCYPDPAVRAAAAAHMRRAPAPGAVQGEGGRWLELPTRTKDGRAVPVLWTNLQLAGGRQVGVGVDLRERNAAAAAVAAERALLRAVLEQMPLGVTVTEAPSGAILFANSAGERLLGHPLDQAADLSRYGAFGAEHEDGRSYAPAEYPAARALAGETVDQHLMRYRRGDGVVTHLAVSAAPVYDAEGRLVRAVCAWTDVHERVALEAALRQARDLADAANRAKSEFLANMSHELRTPLNAIQGHVQLLAMELHGPITEAQRGALDRVMRAQHHLLGLINDVLNFAKLEAGRVEYAVEEVEVGAMLGDVAAIMEPQMRAQGLAFSVPAPPPAGRVWADADKLRQVLLNLLSNAVKFTPAGGVVEVAGEAPADDAGVLRLHVRDTGIGIPADKLEAVFEPFVQVSGGRTRVQQGTGLGLAISRDLTRGMGGDLTVASVLGGGSTFTISLRRVETASGEPADRRTRDERREEERREAERRSGEDRREADDR